jgi:hypothetical protein
MPPATHAVVSVSVSLPTAAAGGGYPIVTCTSSAPERNHHQVCGAICESCGSPVPLPFEP